MEYFLINCKLRQIIYQIEIIQFIQIIYENVTEIILITIMIIIIIHFIGSKIRIVWILFCIDLLLLANEKEIILFQNNI